MLVLPDFYDENVIGVYPQGPCSVFVYWELSDDQWNALKSLNGRLVLRLFKLVDDNGFDYQYLQAAQVEPPAATYSWYFTGLEPGAMYNVEICSRLNDGKIIPIIKSGQITTPPTPKFDPAPKGEILFQKPTLDLSENEKELCHFNMAGLRIDTKYVFDRMPFYMGVSSTLAG